MVNSRAILPPMDGPTRIIVSPVEVPEQLLQDAVLVEGQAGDLPKPGMSTATA